MRLLVVGNRGMLGTDLVAELERRGHDVVGVDLGEIDITDPASVAQIPTGAFGDVRWVVNCAAYTAVDKAESEEQLSAEVNALGPGYLAHACKLVGARLLHISTDFVFDGTATEPYPEDAPTAPLGVYGRTKRDGENAVLDNHPNAIVVRTAWLYGANGKSFPATMIGAWKSGRSLRVVADQVGCPTYTEDLAAVLADLIEKDAFPGIYHAVGPEAMSWHAFALRAIQAAGGTDVAIEPIPTDAYPTPARRPAYSVLGTQKLSDLGLPPMPPVDDALRRFVTKRQNLA